MNWTRMADEKGGYLAVVQCYGEKRSIRVFRDEPKMGHNRPFPWRVEINGKPLAIMVNGQIKSRSRTLKEAKALATIDVDNWIRSIGHPKPQAEKPAPAVTPTIWGRAADAIENLLKPEKPEATSYAPAPTIEPKATLQETVDLAHRLGYKGVVVSVDGIGDQYVATAAHTSSLWADVWTDGDDEAEDAVNALYNRLRGIAKSEEAGD